MLMEPRISSFSLGFHAAVDVTIGTAAGLIAILFCCPILILTTAVKMPLKAFLRWHRGCVAGEWTH